MLAHAPRMDFIPISDGDAAIAFYQGVLGLTLLQDTPFAIVFDGPGGQLRLAKTPDFTPQPFTVVGWVVDDLESAQTRLEEKGLSFEFFDGLPQDERGVWTVPDGYENLLVSKTPMEMCCLSHKLVDNLRSMRRILISTTMIGALTACQPELVTAEKFFDSFEPYCGKAFAGELVSEDEVDASFVDAAIVMHIRDCSADEIRIPLHVGENRSRTWILSKTDTGLRLKHDHRHEDGAPDAITMYGGDSRADSRDPSFEFPTDTFSKTVFDKEGIPDSKQNTWVVELDPETNLFAYQMSRPNRFFRLEFDLTQPVDVPPPAWGYE